MKTEHGRTWYAIGEGMCGGLVAPASAFCTQNQLAGKLISFAILSSEKGEPDIIILDATRFPPLVLNCKTHDLGLVPIADVVSLPNWPELPWIYEPCPGQAEVNIAPPTPGNPERFRSLALKCLDMAIRGEDLPWVADLSVGCLIATDSLSDIATEIIPDLKSPIEYGHAVAAAIVAIVAFHKGQIPRPPKAIGPVQFNN